MKRTLPLHVRASTLTFIGLIGIVALLFQSAQTYSQIGCCNPSPYSTPTAAKWPRFATVRVTISTAFTETERQAIVDAFLDWNSANTLNCSGVTFTDFSFSATPPPENSTYTHWVKYQNNITNPAGQTFISTDPRAYTILTGSIGRVGMSELPAYIRGLMRHEIGHTLFLENPSLAPVVVQ